MKNIEKAKILDYISREMLDHQKEINSICYNYNFVETLFYRQKKENNSIFNAIPQEPEMAEDLFNLIYNQEFDGNPILKQIDHTNSSQNTGNPYYNTHEFLKSGGFFSLYVIENRIQEKKMEKENNDFNNSKNQAILSKKQRITFSIAIIALELSIFNTFFKIN